MKVVALFVLFFGVAPSVAFLLGAPSTSPRKVVSSDKPRFRASSSSTDEDTLTSLDGLRAKTVKELKQELEALRVSTHGALEKEDLVQRLFQARQNGAASSGPKGGTSTQPSSGGTHSTTDVLTVPLLMSSIEHDIPVSGKNMPGKDEWTLRPSEQPYCTIQVQVHPSNGGPIFELSLLLDTACSGILLRPEVVEKHNLQVVTSPVTMTSGGGTASSNSQVTNVAFSLLNSSSEQPQSKRRFGPLPAVVQDIGALPRALDGIVGLSFLNQFDSVEFDFVNSQVSFFDNPPPNPSGELELVGQGDMYLLGSLGIYAVDTWWAGRGPLRMLVDTGAASTYWSWSGVTKDLQIPRDSPMLQKLPGFMGLMGSDNIANPLTHRIYVSSRMGLKEGAGLELADKRLAIDIGNIPILQQLQQIGIGGIVGLDVLRRCSRVRIRCTGDKPYLRLYQLKDRDY